MRLYDEAIKMADLRDKRKCYTLEEDDTITETFTHPSKKDYIGKYKSNGNRCNCSWYADKLLCRHQIVFRMKKNLPIFDKDMFHKSHVKPHALNPDEILEVSLEDNNEEPQTTCAVSYTHLRAHET